MTRTPIYRWYGVGFLLALTAKFWLIWESEIRDSFDDPHEYLLQIMHPVNGGLFYGPGTGLVGRFFYQAGIPFRLGIEASFLLALVLMLRGLFDWPWKSGWALALFWLVAFDPAMAQLFSYLFSDSVWLVALMSALAFFVLAFRAEGELNWGCLLASLLFFSLTAVTRSTVAAQLAGIMVFALFGLALLIAKYRSVQLRRSLHLLALSVPTLIFGLSFIFTGTCRYNLSAHGYSGLSCMDCRETKDFYMSLQSVGEPTGPRYFPIDEERRKLIAAAGPNAAWFVHEIEANGFYKKIGQQYYGRYDIATGWLPWAIFTATIHDGNYMPAFAFYRQVEKEIDDAGRQGRLKVRATVELPDTRLGIVADALPEGLRRTLRQILAEPPSEAFTWNPGLYVDPDFTKYLHRREVQASPVRERIWPALVRVYRWLYTPALLLLFAATLLSFVTMLLVRWKTIEFFSFPFLTQQLILIYYLIFVIWYALFDASGLPVLYRYMMFQHIFLPILLVYYARKAWLLYQEKPAV